MKFLQKLEEASKKNKSLLCVGLDPDLSKIPRNFRDKLDPIFEFNKNIINQTKDYVCAYKPNAAFYEALGNPGTESLKRTIEYVKVFGIPVILDAKRGDIGNSSAAYAKAAFDVLRADAITVSPYMGKDSVQPFLDYRDKGVFVLCLTSNEGSRDFQAFMYMKVAEAVSKWNNNGNCGLVVGATRPEQLKEISAVAGDMPILIPGVGAQQGDLEAVVKNGGPRPIINSSRGIIYDKDPHRAAKELRDRINELLSS